MSSERWQKIDQILAQLFDCPAERQAQFLDEACAGDEVLRQEVEALLAAQRNAGSLLETPPAAVTEIFAPLPRALLGQQLGRYRILSLLGAGGMGEVYRARDQRLDREVAVKILTQKLSANPEARRRFEREAKAIASLTHPNILAIHDFGIEQDLYFAVTELLEGETLRERLKRGLALSWPEAARIGVEIAAGLAAAHAKGIIHRDLKPENIFLLSSGQVKILDFGIARIKAPAVTSAQRSSALSTLTEMTAPGRVMGTCGYMSPEQVRGEVVDFPSDVFSFGCVLYEMLTGHAPFRRDSVAETLAAILRDEPRLPPAARKTLPAELLRIVQKCLVKNLPERYQRAGDVSQDLKALRQEHPTRVFTDAEQTMEDEPSALTTPLEPEMAHILFMDLVGYSKLPTDEQVQQQQTLHQLVQQTKEFRRAQQQNQLISLPTGDGMALVFFRDPMAPVQCAIELAQFLRTQPELALRMGVHSGLVYRVADINANRNVAGGGINIAQRVMDCGDAGHILISSTVAGVLGEAGHWGQHLTDWGEQEVKHGARIHLYNLYTGEVGKPEVPAKLRHTLPPTNPPANSPSSSLVFFRRPWVTMGAVILLCLSAFSLFWYYGREKLFPAAPTSHAPIKAETILVAILPFEDASLPKDAAVISEGIIEEIISLLSRYPNLRVTARSTVFRYKGQAIDPQKIGRELNVAYLLTGRMIQDKERYVVKTEFIKTTDGSLVLDSNYSRPSNELPTLAADITQHISAKLKTELTAEEKDHLQKGYTQSPPAYQLFLAGRHLLRKRNPEDCFKSIELFQRAIALDPQFANAYASLAEANFLASGEVRDLPRPQGDPAALAAAKKAVAIDASLAEAHAMLGASYLYWEYNWTQAEQEYKRALELNPSYPIAHFWYGNLLIMQKRFDEARRQMQQAVELDPLSPAILCGLGHYFYFSRQFEQAAQQFWKAIELDNNYQEARYWLGNTYVQLKDYPKAIDQYVPPISIAEENDNGKLSRQSQETARLRRAAETQGMPGYWRTKVSFWDGKTPNVDFPAVILGHLYAYLGDKEKALAALKLACDARSTSLKDVSGLLYLKVDPRLDLLRGDPRFEDLIRQLGLLP